MSKISMDALNAGWEIGFGTGIRYQNADFDYAVSRNDIVVPEPTQAGTLRTFFIEFMTKAEEFLGVVGRRLVR
jgi:hypothetical protein